MSTAAGGVRRGATIGVLDAGSERPPAAARRRAPRRGRAMEAAAGAKKGAARWLWQQEEEEGDGRRAMAGAVVVVGGGVGGRNPLSIYAPCSPAPGGGRRLAEAPRLVMEARRWAVVVWAGLCSTRKNMGRAPPPTQYARRPGRRDGPGRAQAAASPRSTLSHTRLLHHCTSRAVSAPSAKKKNTTYEASKRPCQPRRLVDRRLLPRGEQSLVSSLRSWSMILKY